MFYILCLTVPPQTVWRSVTCVWRDKEGMLFFNLILLHPLLGIPNTLKLDECKSSRGTCCNRANMYAVRYYIIYHTYNCGRLIYFFWHSNFWTRVLEFIKIDINPMSALITDLKHLKLSHWTVFQMMHTSFKSFLWHDNFFTIFLIIFVSCFFRFLPSD